MNIFVETKHSALLNEKINAHVALSHLIKGQIVSNLREKTDATVFVIDFNKSQILLNDLPKFIICEQPDVILPAVSTCAQAYYYSIDQFDDLINDLYTTLHTKNKDTEKNKIYSKPKSELKIKTLQSQLLEKTIAIRGFVAEENLKRIKEKKLLYFLDFLNAEQNKSDFLDQLTQLLWSDLKKIGSFYTLGFIVSADDGEKTLISFDGKELNFNSNITFEFNDDQSASTQLANLIQRPLGQTKFWHSKKDQTSSFFYLENRGGVFITEPLENYVTERIELIILVIQRHIIQLNTSYLLNKWTVFGRAYSHPMHVIDSDYNLIQSNYAQPGLQDQKCYQVLAGRIDICVNCPLKTQEQPFIFIRNQKYKAYANKFFIDKNYYFIFYDDQSELDLLKSKMIQNEKMQVIGQLANHLAHELNNPLTGLKLATEFILQQPENADLSVRSDFQEVLKGLIRCQNIISDLIDFSTDVESQLQISNAQDVVRKTIPLLKSITRNHSFFIDLKNVPIKINVANLQQVLFNLIKNSCEAIPNKGVIKIYDIDYEAHYDIYCEDNGAGLPESVQSSLFQPFTTTKIDGEGTGLGLYISKNLMSRMAAQIIHDSSFKNGTRFILRFIK